MGVVDAYSNISGATTASSSLSSSKLAVYGRIDMPITPCIAYLWVYYFHGLMFQGPAMFHHFHLTPLYYVYLYLQFQVHQSFHHHCHYLYQQVTCHAVQYKVFYLSDSDERSCRMAVMFCKLEE